MEGGPAKFSKVELCNCGQRQTFDFADVQSLVGKVLRFREHLSTLEEIHFGTRETTREEKGKKLSITCACGCGGTIETETEKAVTLTTSRKKHQTPLKITKTKDCTCKENCLICLEPLNAVNEPLLLVGCCHQMICFKCVEQLIHSTSSKSGNKDGPIVYEFDPHSNATQDFWICLHCRVHWHTDTEFIMPFRQRKPRSLEDLFKIPVGFDWSSGLFDKQDVKKRREMVVRLKLEPDYNKRIEDVKEVLQFNDDQAKEYLKDRSLAPDSIQVRDDPEEPGSRGGLQANQGPGQAELQVQAQGFVEVIDLMDTDDEE